MLASGALRPRGRALRRFDRRARGDRVARRRQARYGGKGVRTRSRNVNGEIARALVGLEAADQAALDRALIELDGTPNKSRLGANAILGVSLAVGARAAADARPAAVPLYRRRQTRRAAGADDERPQRRRARRQHGGLPGVHDRAGRRADASPRRLRMGRRGLPRARKASCTSAGSRPAVGDEGGFAPDLAANEAALELLIEAIESGRL